MYYRLKSDYILRGWDKMAWVLVQRPENQVRKLGQAEFQTLLLCDGTTDLESEEIPDVMKSTLHQLEEEGIVEPCAAGTVLEDDQYYQYYNNRFVSSVFWSVTGKCNFRCRHCYMDASIGALGELSHEQALALIDQMAECGVLHVDITGGEPFVREDFWSLVDRIGSYKMTIRQIYTNGWLLDETVLDEFERRGMRPEIRISFDGVGWHDWMRGVTGAEEAAIRAICLCMRRGFPVGVGMCIHKGNLDSLRETVKRIASLGVQEIKCGFVSETDLWKKNNSGNFMDYKAYIEAMIDFIPCFYEDGMPIDLILGGVVSLYKNSVRYQNPASGRDDGKECSDRHLCGAARYACYITPEGRLLPCMPMTACREQELFPLVQDIGLKRGLSDSFYMNFVDSRVRDLLAANPECAACEYRYRCCGGCRANALAETGDLMGCDRGQCFLWKEGYVERISRATEDAIAKYCKDHVEENEDTGSKDPSRE